MNKIAVFLKKELTRIAAGFLLFLIALILEFVAKEAFAFWFYLAALVISGFSVFFDAVRGILRRDFLDEKFLMSIASVGAMIVGEWSEGVAVMLFFLVGEFFEHKAVARSRKSIKELMDICPDTATVVVDGEELETDAEDVEEGSLIVIRAGERVPIDSVVVDGFSDVDVSCLTGESLPVSVSLGDEVKSGSVLLNGMIYAKTLRIAEESAAARILNMVENANESKSVEENFITKFSRVYTPVVIALALLLAVIPPIFKLSDWSDSIYRALIFVVISCPCALVISVPMAFFGGIGRAAASGILFKGGNIFSKIADVKTVAFDKTGTLTTGEFSVNSVVAFSISQKELLSLAATAEDSSLHPISIAIKKAAESFEKPEESEYFAGKGARAKLGDKEILVGNSRLMKDFGVHLSSYSDKGVIVAINRELRGFIEISDSVKKEAGAAIDKLKELGVDRAVMISGDKKSSAERVARELSLDACYSELLPEEKYEKIEELKNERLGSLIYVGDGINDSPALARADVGVAMGALGSDSAISASDVVLVSDNLKKLPEAIKIARKTLRIAKENIIFALGVKFAIMILGAFGIANMWLAVFADVGVAVIAILNSMRTLRKGRG